MALKNPWPDYTAQPIVTDEDGFALEHAMQIGFEPVDDNAEIYAIRQCDLLRIMHAMRSGGCVVNTDGTSLAEILASGF